MMGSDVSEGNSPWFEQNEEKDDSLDDVYFKEYDITMSPNDFNIKTIFDIIQSGNIIIPGFQRHYVWDRKRASKLIESIIMGLPIPQIFLYEKERDKFLVIDGQQRLMTIYYFIKRRFPKQDKRIDIRAIFEKEGKISDAVLNDDAFFEKFDLIFPTSQSDHPLYKKNYETLYEYKIRFDMRTIRNIIIKQTFPSDDYSSVFEIFNRLNTGGVTLTPQEIRASLYDSEFFNMLNRLNVHEAWRRLLGVKPDLHLKDIEILLRAFAMLMKDSYKPPMVQFLNSSSGKFKNESKKNIEYYEKFFESFLDSCKNLENRAFFGNESNRFSIPIFESVFVAVCQDAFQRKSYIDFNIEQNKVDALKNNIGFNSTAIKDTVSKENVEKRHKIAREIFCS